MNQPLIAFSGKAGSGKSTAASYVAENCGFAVRSFAGAVRDEVRDFLRGNSLPFEERHLTGGQADKSEKFLLPVHLVPPCECAAVGSLLSMADQEDDQLQLSYRQLLQWWGTDYRRAQQRDYWLKRMAEKIDGPTVIDDCRFPNEAEFVRQRGGLLLRIERPHLPAGSHASETALDDWPDFDLIIRNVHGLAQLAEVIAGAVDAYLARCPGRTEVYSRVCGFFRPVQAWNRGKRAEFSERKEYRP